MAKLKTNKATKKRLRITGAKKIIKRKSGQDHFNTRETGKITRNKRRDSEINKSIKKTIKILLPYS